MATPDTLRFDPCMQVLNPTIEILLVGLPCHPVDAGRGISLERVERRSQHDRADMVQERGELLFFRCRAACRTRSNASDTLSRSCGLVQHRLRLLAFPMRTGGVLPLVEPETSRFLCKELPRMPGSLTTAEQRVLALSHLPMLPSVLSSTSASGLGLSRLNGWPMRSPVNASPTPSRVSTHDSGASVVRYTFTARDRYYVASATT